MPGQTYRLEILDGRATTVKAHLPEGLPRGGVILAHGMANDLDIPLISETAEHLAGRGWTSVRFNFLYREEGRERADSEEVLLATLKRVYEDSLTRFNLEPSAMVVGGKSLGARITTRAAAEGLEAAAIVYLGFPLHPPGRPDLGRDDLVKAVPLPQLFVAGTRDHLCPLDRLRGLVEKLTVPVKLHVIEGGDHSFVLPGGDERTEAEIISEISRVTGDWLETVLG